MKRILVTIGLLLTTNCYAGTITIAPFISGNDVTISALETQRQTLQNVINGSIEGGGQNIRQGSITSYDLATAINPVTFRNEAFNDFTVTGMLAPTSGSLSSTTTAGVSYVNGVRVETSATAHTYTASKDTYVYINAGGFFDYEEVANGASAPSTPANCLLLFKAVTSGSAVTTVTDMRTLSIQITSNSSNFAQDYRNQAYVSRDSTVNFYIAPGQFSIGSSYYTNTAVTSTKSIVTGSNWIENGYPSGYAGLVFIYGYNSSGTAFDFKFSSADVAYADESQNTAGIKRYYINSGTTYRALGWAYLSADTVQLFHTSDLKDTNTSNSVSLSTTTSVNTTSTNFINDGGAPMIRFYSSGRPVEIIYSAQMANDNTASGQITIAIDGIDNTAATAGFISASATTTLKITAVSRFQGILSRGVHSIQARFKSDSSTTYVNGRTLTVREL